MDQIEGSLRRFAMRRIRPGLFLASACYLAAFVLAALIVGCSWVSPNDGAQNKRLFSLEELSEPYDQITLRTSLTIDALPKIQRFQSDRGPLLGGVEVLSEGESTVATLGQNKDGRRTWFNMVVFHEFRLNVVRKYFFIVDERAKRLTARPSRGMRLDCKIVLEGELLNRSYSSENVKRIAILEYISKNLRADIEELGVTTDSPNQHNKMLSVCGMLINQTLEMILLKLDSSPVLAAKLGSTGGINFDHINFGDGKVRMIVQNDAAAFTMRFGAFVDVKEGLQ
jgi:hypothetical protein